jgi:hypothetical protein
MTKEQKFSFWLPVNINKATDPNTGLEIMRLGGIASTKDVDTDGESLDPKGFDIQPLLETGTVNWHHQAKGQPATIIGEPSKAEIRKDGLYIETDLYPSSKVANDVWQLAQTMEKDSKTRRLGYSIEGKVLERKSNNKKSPDYKIIKKAAITGVAITHMPKNPKTFANIIKGEIDEDDIIEQAIEATNLTGTDTTDSTVASGAALKNEDLDEDSKNQEFTDLKKLSKGDVIYTIMNDHSFITIEKAEQIYKLISKISVMTKKEFITDEDIQKAYGALGLDSIEKGGKDGRGTGSTGEGKTNKDGSKVEDMPEDEDDDFVDDPPQGGGKAKKEIKKANSPVLNDFQSRFDRIEKAVATGYAATEKYIKASAVLVKACNDKLDAAKEREEELMEIIKGQEDTIFDLKECISELGNSTPAPKSMRSNNPIDRIFQKANQNDLSKGEDDGDDDEDDEGNVKKAVSMSKNKAIITELLDQATFAKGGFDNELSTACTNFDVTGRLSPAIISRMKNEFGVNIVK